MAVARLAGHGHVNAEKGGEVAKQAQLRAQRQWRRSPKTADAQETVNALLAEGEVRDRSCQLADREMDKSAEIWNCTSVTVGGVNSARGQDTSFGGDAGYVCLGAVHMEEEVQDGVQVEVGREEQGEGDTRKEQSEEQRKNRRSINRSSWMTMETFLSYVV